jgi:hypothetical protein
MSNFELKKKAVELIKRYFDMTIKIKDVVLLEFDINNGECTFLYFSVGKSPVSYLYRTGAFKCFCMYPNGDGSNGMELEWIEE